ncbi:MAG: phosphomethylpyrimidine synthase ThiC [Candidatus Omnitrophica bacterium]|nr:phosphomethylpyrimidine synthase ThiC [Candidatus Omnitrophota bacterium]
MTLIQKLKKGNVPGYVKNIARCEEVSESFIVDKILKGEVVIPGNPLHKDKRFTAIGSGMNVKINVNIGTSGDRSDIILEKEKIELAEEMEADTIMDLSVGGDICRIRRELISKTVLPFGTVPVYQVAASKQYESGSILGAGESDFFSVLQQQAEDGVDFFTIHAGINFEAVDRIKKSSRVLDVVSRGGALLFEWMEVNQKENPYYKYFERVLEIAQQYDITISLGDALRPGSVFDAGDELQYYETLVIAELIKKAKDFDVQVMVEGPGHVPLHKIEHQIKAIKDMTFNAPLYVLGPLVVDSAAGYDHINAAIGAAIAGYAGADFLCYLTPAEHLCLPDINDVRDGIMAFKIAQQAVNLSRGKRAVLDRELKVSQARKKRDWDEQMKLFLDNKKAMHYRSKLPPSISDTCSMCSKYCSIKIMDGHLSKNTESAL